MANWITKRNVTILNLVLLGVFVITLIAVAVPLTKSAQTPSSLSDEKRSAEPKVTAELPRQQKTYVCPNHANVTSNSPGKCPECGSELKEVDTYAAIVDRDLFDAHLVKRVEVPVVIPPPLNLELVGVFKYPDRLVAIIRDRGARTKGGYPVHIVGVGDELPGHFGTIITSVTLEPQSVKYYRPLAGEEELTMETAQRAPGAPKEGWSKVIQPMKTGRTGSTYVVKIEELAQQIESPEDYRRTFELEPATEGTKVVGLKIANMPVDNFLYAAGFRMGDVIKSINGSVITDEGSALNLLRSATQGSSLQVVIERGRLTLTMVYSLYKERRVKE